MHTGKWFYAKNQWEHTPVDRAMSIKLFLQNCYAEIDAICKIIALRIRLWKSNLTPPARCNWRADETIGAAYCWTVIL